MKKKKNGYGAVIAVLVIVLIAVLGFIGYNVYGKITDDINGRNQGSESYTLKVNQGYIDSIGEKLAQNKIVINDIIWVNWMNKNYPDFEFKRGEYKLTADMSYEEIVQKLTKPDVNHEVVKVTIPEGFNCMQIAARLEKKGICKADEFLEVCKSTEGFDYDFLSSVPDSKLIAYKLEGFLFPATYDFDKNSDPREIAGEMLEAFGDRLTDEMQAFCDEHDMTLFEFITLASIVQEEALTNDSAKNIASVFMNRLDINMKLQSDVTIFYARDLQDKQGFSEKVYNAYSTYQCDSLPAGPITNSGEAVINAVINYPETEYIFFFSDLKQEFHFAKTYQEFEELKAKYPWKE